MNFQTVSFKLLNSSVLSVGELDSRTNSHLGFLDFYLDWVAHGYRG